MFSIIAKVTEYIVDLKNHMLMVILEKTDVILFYFSCFNIDISISNVGMYLR